MKDVNFRNVILKNPDGIVIIDRHGITSFVNPAAEKLFGIDAAEFQGKPFGHPVSKTEETEIHIIREFSEPIQAAMRSTEIVWEGNPATLISLRDITERKKAVEALIQSKKSEAVTRLASGIAHEFNNALYIITGNVELLRDDNERNKSLHKYATAIETSAMRMAGLTTKLMAYARQGHFVTQNIPANIFVKETVPIIQHALDPGIRIKMVLSSEVCNIRIDTLQMQIVLSEVMANAAEAIQGDGRIIIRTSNETVAEDLLESAPHFKPGLFVCIRVEDNGEGMDPSGVNQLFDPFFSTRAHGRGLGMAAALGIVDNHGGMISVKSTPDEGTVVRILLPSDPPEMVIT